MYIFTTSNDRIIAQKTRKDLENSKHYQPTGSNRHLRNIPPSRFRIYIYFKYPWDKYQDRSYTGP